MHQQQNRLVADNSPMSVTLYKMPVFGIPMSQVRDEVHDGLFVMGGPGLSYGNPTPHWVGLPGGAELSLGHVTESQFCTVMRASQDGSDLLDDIAKTYRERWGRSFGQKEFKDHPMTCVSWDDLTVFFHILNGVLGITNESQKYRRPTEAESEFMIRGGWVCLQEVAEQEKTPINNWNQFLEFIKGRFENIVSEIAVNSSILNIGNASNEEELKKLFESGQRLYALRVYGSTSGRLDKSIWWNQWGKKTNVRKVELSFDSTDQSPYEQKDEAGERYTVYRREDFLNEDFREALEQGKALHPYGLIDATGNVYGWCEDDWDEKAYRRQPGIENPLVKIQNNRIKVVRGGSWGGSDPFSVRAADRFGNHSDCRGKGVGIRCARGPQDSK